MKKLPIVARALAFASLAAMLAGCKTVAQSETTGGISHDYRLRHPIAVREGKQTLTVFIGDRRGGLTPLQRTEVGALASGWRREATGGFVIEVPVGAANERAAASASREIRAVLDCHRRTRPLDRDSSRTDAGPVRLGTIRVNYPKMVAETGPCGLWPDDLGPTTNVGLHEQPSALEPRLRHTTQSCRAGRRAGRSRAAARRDAGADLAPRHRARQVPQGRSDRDAIPGCQQRQDQRRRPMIKFALKGGDAAASHAEAAVQDEHIAPVPRISIQAFCASSDTAAAMQAAGEDRRMSKAHLKVQMGGMTAAIEAYRASATPNVVIIEADGRGDELLAGLDTLAEVCDAGTRVVVVGNMNDIVLYREMVRRGVSDYLITPIGTLDIIRAVSGLFYAATPSRSAARSRWSAPRAASAPRRSRTISPSRSRATSSSTPSSPISTCRSAPPGSTSTRTRRKASPTP